MVQKLEKKRTLIPEEKEIENKIFSLIDKYFSEKDRAAFIAGKTKIQYSGPIFDQNEVKAVLKSLFDGWLAAGKLNKEFERLFANFIGSKGCVTVNSGSSALLIAWACLKNHRLKKPLKSGDEVITTAMTHPATINCLLQNGLTPVLVDVERDTLNINPSLVNEAISKKTRAILPLHFLGNPCDMDQLKEIAEKYDLFTVEDCCDAHGSEYKNSKLGSIGDLGAFSFYPAHAITMGEGGAITYNKYKIYGDVLKSLRSWGVACASCPYKPCKIAQDPNYECPFRFKAMSKVLRRYDRRHLFVDVGYNLKIIEMQAAFGVEQMKKLPLFIEKRRENWAYIAKSLERYNDYMTIQKPTPNSKPSPFGVALVIEPDAPFRRHDLIKWLEKHMIETRHLFAGDIRDQPAYRDIQFKAVGDFENTKLARDNGFFIGCYPGITKKMREYVLSTFETFFSKYT